MIFCVYLIISLNDHALHLKCLLLPPSPPTSRNSGHSGLLAVPQTRRSGSCPRAFAPAVSFARKALPPQHLILRSDSMPPPTFASQPLFMLCPSPRTAFTQCPQEHFSHSSRLVENATSSLKPSLTAHTQDEAKCLTGSMLQPSYDYQHTPHTTLTHNYFQYPNSQ